MTEKIYTMESLAEYLGVTLRTIYGLTASKRIAHFKVGRENRFTQSMVDAYIKSTSVTTEAEDIRQRAIQYCAQHPLPVL
ncbi:MAG: helix-turn-helix domain-containing protein [Alistipes sp.]|nr:helix-turn-helix domain-containing protein [Alistipes sp.]